MRRVGACARFLGVRGASGPAGGSACLLPEPCARAGGGEDWLTHAVWQRQRFIADAGSDGAGGADADSSRRLKLLPAMPCWLHVLKR